MGYSIFEDTMADMTWLEVDRSAKEGAIVLFPMGVIEEHGPHMCLGVDTYLGYTKCRLMKQKLEEKNIKTIIAPPFYWGINNVTGDFPRSFTSRRETVKAVIYDIMASLKILGFTYVFGVNHHGDTEHCIALMEGIKEARMGTGIRAYYIIPGTRLKFFGLKGSEPYIIISGKPSIQTEQPRYIDIHAGEGETAEMNRYFPELVDTELAKTLEPTNLNIDTLKIWSRGWSEAKKLTPEGYVENPANFENSEGNFEDYAQRMSDLIEAFLNGTYRLPETV